MPRAVWIVLLVGFGVSLLQIIFSLLIPGGSLASLPWWIWLPLGSLLVVYLVADFTNTFGFRKQRRRDD